MTRVEEASGRGDRDIHGRAYHDMSYWLRDVGDLTPRPALDGDVEVDVAILGAGYTGLWTAYYLLEHQPDIRVAVVESEIAGYGASGRNGGWCNASMVGVSPGEMAERYGEHAAQAVFGMLRETVDEVERVCRTEELDVDWRKSGVLRAAVGPHERPLMEERWQTLKNVGLADGCELLDAAQLHERIRIEGAQGAVFDPNVAFHHPAKLVRGLADVIETRGATIYEQTAVVEVEVGATPRLRTERGDVRAQTLVLAGEAYMTQLPGWRRRMLPVYSLITLTEPLSDAQWAEVGWDGGECLSSHSLSVDYLSRTHDGRILFGGRGAPYRFGSKLMPEAERHAETHELLRNRLRNWFPALRDIGFSHSWGGPLGVTRDWLPSFVHDRTKGYASYHGYAGQGVAPSNLAGRMLADSVTGRRGSPVLGLPLAKHRARSWEPEPFRWIGVRFVQRGLASIDRRSQRTGKPPTGRSLSERLSKH